jgi:hypothetical protein
VTGVQTCALPIWAGLAGGSNVSRGASTTPVAGGTTSGDAAQQGVGVHH